MSRLRLAIVGVGHLGKIHARLAAGIPEIELVAVVDSRADARDAVAAEARTRGVGEYRELFGEIDAAVVATPTSTHHKVASELMRGGVHVLVEKPLCPTSAEADELVQMARRRQLVLQVGHVERFNPGLVSVAPLLADAKFIQGTRQSGYTFRSTDVGVVMDLMIHDIDAALAIVKSPVVDVEAVGASVMGDHEDMASARLKFANGAVATLTASRTSYAPERKMQVFTPTRFASIDFGAKRATIVEPRIDLLDRSFSPGELSDADRTRYREGLFEHLLVKRELPALDTNAIEEELRDFAGAIAAGRAPRVTGADGRDAVAIAERVLESLRQHAWDGSRDGRIGPVVPGIERRVTASIQDALWSDDDTVILRRKAG